MGSHLPYSSTPSPKKAHCLNGNNSWNERLLCRVQFTHRGTKSFTKPACNQTRRASKTTHRWGGERQTAADVLKVTQAQQWQSRDRPHIPAPSLSHATSQLFFYTSFCMPSCRLQSKTSKPGARGAFPRGRHVPTSMHTDRPLSPPHVCPVDESSSGMRLVVPSCHSAFGSLHGNELRSPASGGQRVIGFCETFPLNLLELCLFLAEFGFRQDFRKGKRLE